MDISAITSTAPGMSGNVQDMLRNAHTPAQQRKAVAQQFEAILLRQFLQESVGSMMGNQDTPEGSVYGYLITDQLASKLAEGGGMGLSSVLERQLAPPGEASTPDQKGPS